MLSRFARLLLVTTSLAPFILTWAFADLITYGGRLRQVTALVAVVGLLQLCILIIVAARNQLPQITFNVSSVRTADSEVVGFMVAYLLPLVTTTTKSIDLRMLAFVFVLLSAVLLATHAYHFNPLLNMLGYHFYEVETDGNVTYLLLTKRNLHSTRDVKKVAQLTNYIVVDLDDD